ncbi:synaptobrevin family protein [Stylonychia lemnae]|uniref:Synaptobrevin family protein n=1 Tax=Stylonychia lemnae TaxID=5949 RepID=A0A078A0Y2_STYLE|nr:synaptobrevin family protein [Stylonychia lemnae]|eukprot:CDW75785.1 synaptobrevin family protein [Stylonychia lemnae]
MLKNTFISRASDGLILCETYDSVTDTQVERLKQKSKELMKKIGNVNQLSTANIDDHCFHTMVQDGIVYLVIAEKNYPQKLAFLYLSEINDAFQDELRNTYGTSGVDYNSKIETIENSYSFLKFEKVIAKKRKDFRDSNATENINKLNQELLDVSKIMSENFEMILNRGGNLGKISQMSTELKDSSSKVNQPHFNA